MNAGENRWSMLARVSPMAMITTIKPWMRMWTALHRSASSSMYRANLSTTMDASAADRASKARNEARVESRLIQSELAIWLCLAIAVALAVGVTP